VNRNITHSFQIALLILWTITGCSVGGSDPVANDLSVPDSAAPSSAAQAHHCLGLYCLVVDTKTGEIDIIPLRSADWHFNLTGVLNATMGVSAAGVPSEHDPPNGLFVFDISLTHPFATKPQFAGFDVKGILMTPGTLAVGPLVFADLDETQLENADGYARWWNPTEFTAPGILGYTKGAFAAATAAQLTATVNPYKLFADILGPEDSLSWVTGEPLDSDRGRAVFSAGSVNTRRYRIRFPMSPGPQVIFGYAIDAAWAAPSPNPPGEVPDDFPMNANQPEAYRIAIMPTANSLYFDSESGEGGGALKLQINVHDWQGQIMGNTESQVSAVRVYAPGMTASGVDGVFLNEDSLKARYTADLTGLAVPTEAGATQIVCRVESWGGSSYKQAGAPAPDSPVSAFQAITLDIPDPECSADTNNDFGEALDLDLQNPTVDRLCAPGDYRDFFKMDLPLAHQISGNLTLYCDPVPTKLALYDESQALISEVSVSAGSASLDLGALGVMPGTYYIRVLTQTSGQAFLYLIEPSLDVADVTPGNAVDVAPFAINFDPTRVIAYGDYAIAVSQIGLFVFDYTDKMNPELLSSVPLEIGAKPGFTYPYIYCPDLQGLSSVTMIDISDPHNPVVHEDILSPGGFVVAALAEPGYLYVALQGGNVFVYDIASDPAAPALAGSFSHTTSPQDWVLVHDEGSSSYWLAMCESGPRLSFYDVTDKSAITGPKYIEWLGPGSVLRTVAAIDNYCFAVLWQDSNYYLVSTHIDLGGPTYKGNEPIWYPGLFLEVSGDYAYAVSELNMAVVDISDPDDPKDPVHFSHSEAQINDMDLDGHLMFHALRSAGLRCHYVDGAPATYGRVYGMSAPIDMAVQDQYLFVSESAPPYHAVKSVNIADPANAFMADELVLDHMPLSIAVSGGRMAVETEDKYILAIDCSDPTNLAQAGLHLMGVYMTDLGINGTELYAGRAGASFDVFSLTSWPTLTFLKNVTIPVNPEKFLFKDSFMYVLAGGEILVYSIVDPSNPALQDTYTPLAAAADMELRGDYLYIATSGSLEIADISTPQSPTFVASEPDPNAPDGHFVSALDQFVILRPATWGIPTVVRVWPPDDPTVIGPLYGSEYAYPVGGVLASDGYYYERSSSPAIRIFDMY